MAFSRPLTRTLAAAVLGAFMAGAHAAAPQVQTQAPGYYRMALGDFEVTALSDGTVELPVDKLLTNTTTSKIQKALAYYYLKTPLMTSVNGYLINTGSKLVLIDSGAGSLFGPTLGKLVTSLKAAGYTPEQVDEIYITHLHPDHVGGLAANGQRVFPNALVRAEQQDADFWLSQANLDKAPADSKGFFQGAIASVKPYQDAGKFQPFTGDVELQPGIHSLVTRAHTPGHSTYVVESKGQKLVLWGDLIHVASVQMAQPKVAIQFDSDPKNAVVQRKKAFDAAAKDGYWAAGAHLAFPGIGHLRTEGAGYDWLPVNYQNDR
ncbi:MBL fold metallo-hydrolase [Chitinimonas naiadis]